MLTVFVVLRTGNAVTSTKGERQGARSSRRGRTNRDTFLSRPDTIVEYTAPYFGTGRESFYISYACAARYAARVRAMKGKGAEGTGRRDVARDDSGAQGSTNRRFAYGVWTCRFTLHSNCVFPSLSR